MIRTCKHCEDEFDCQSTEKQRVGGYINECPDCVEELGTETHVRYRGCVSGESKQACISILSFDSEKDADTYQKKWEANRGWNNQRKGGLNDIKFKTVTVNNAGDSKRKTDQ